MMTYVRIDVVSQRVARLLVENLERSLASKNLRPIHGEERGP